MAFSVSEILIYCLVTPGENIKSFLTVVEGWRPGLVGANWIFLTCNPFD